MNNSSALHIAIVHRDLHALTRGGICTLYRALANELVERGHHVTLITQHTPHPIAPRRRTSNGGRLDVLSLPRTGDQVSELAAHSQRVSTIVQELGPDVVECSSWEHELLDYFTRGHARVPVVVRGDLSAATMGAHHLVEGEQRLLHQADTVLAVSAFTAADLNHAYGVRARVVPNGVDTTRFHPHISGAPTTGSRIHLDAQGEITHRTPMVEALSSDPLLNRFFDPPTGAGDPRRLVWVGKATQMKGWDRLEDLAVELAGLADLLVVLGHGQVHYPVTIDEHPHVRVLTDLDDEDIARLYTAAGWLVSTSRWEGFGLAIAEALACATPVLLPADLGVAQELLSTGGGATYHTISDLRRHLDAAPPAAQLPETFTWSTNARTSETIYRQTINDHRR